LITIRVPGVFEPEAVLAADIDTVVGTGNAVEARGVDQDLEFVFPPRGFDALGCDAVDRLIHWTASSPLRGLG
jgi:hypothetical protein